MASSETGVEFDDGKTGDITSDATYTYNRKALDPNAIDAAKVWICKRTVTATGTFSFANGVVDFSRPEKCMTLAATLTATYVR